ncbi:hypothetical protein, partial [Cronobacter sakazakii]
EARVENSLTQLAQRIEQIEPRQESKEPLVLQQIGLLISILPEISRLQRQLIQD